MEIQKNNKTWARREGRNSNNNWASENEVGEFLYGFVRMVKPERCLEIGTFEGDGAIAIGKALRDNKLGNLLTVDIADYGQVEVIKKEKFGNRVVIFLEDKIIYDLIELGHQCDFIFIDDGHSYEEASRDLENAHKLCMSNGYILGHDVVSFKTVRQAYNDFLTKYGELYEKIILTSYDGLFILKKI